MVVVVGAQLPKDPVPQSKRYSKPSAMSAADGSSASWRASSKPVPSSTDTGAVRSAVGATLVTTTTAPVVVLALPGSMTRPSTPNVPSSSNGQVVVAEVPAIAHEPVSAARSSTHANAKWSWAASAADGSVAPAQARVDESPSSIGLLAPNVPVGAPFATLIVVEYPTGAEIAVADLGPDQHGRPVVKRVAVRRGGRAPVAERPITAVEAVREARCRVRRGGVGGIS